MAIYAGEADKPFKIKLEAIKGKEIVVVFAENPFPCNVALTLRATLSNMTSSVPFPHTVNLLPGKKIPVLEFRIKAPDSDSYWHYTHRYRLGNLDAVHDDKYEYRLPFETGKTFSVSQAWGGRFSHTGAHKYSVDFRMPEGTPVCAAREGIVVRTKDNSDKNGPDRKFKKQANYIIISHNDGTIGQYLHISKNGARVREGDKVLKGQVIALSGNTGWSRRPHLHFMVTKPINGLKLITLPVKFKTGAGVFDHGLEKGKIYTAVD